MAQLSSVIAVLNQMYPPDLAADWDKVGLVSGDPGQEIRQVVFAVDPLPQVVADARTADLLVTHHPLLLRGVHQVSATGWQGRVIRDLIRSDTALFCAHTNADSANHGVNDALAALLGIKDGRPISAADPGLQQLSVVVPNEFADTMRQYLADWGAGAADHYDSCSKTADVTSRFRPLSGANPAVGRQDELSTIAEQLIEVLIPRKAAADIIARTRTAHPYEVPVISVVDVAVPQSGLGLGRYGKLREPCSLGELAERLRGGLPTNQHGIRIAGNLDREIESVAVCGGAGDSMLPTIGRLGVDAYVTSDLRHHPATDFLADSDCALVDIGHAVGEALWLADAAAELWARMGEQETAITTRVSDINTDPWTAHLTCP